MRRLGSLKARLAVWGMLPTLLTTIVDLVASYDSADRIATLVQDQLLRGSARVISEQLAIFQAIQETVREGTKSINQLLVLASLDRPGEGAVDAYTPLANLASITQSVLEEVAPLAQQKCWRLASINSTKASWRPCRSTLPRSTRKAT